MEIKKIAVIGIFLFTAMLTVQAQNQALQTQVIEPDRVEVTYFKTTNIIFPFAIVGVDIGSRDVLARKAKGAENVLQLKAARDSFPQTNISIITADGKFTSFLVDYSPQPAVLNLSLIGAKQNTLLSSGTNQAQLEYYASTASKSQKKIRGVKDKTFGIGLRLTGLFIHDDLLLLRFHIANETPVNYEVDQLRLYIRDQKKSKRTATQEIEISPLWVHNNTNKISGQSDHTLVLVVPKFTIPDKKYLAVEMMEKNGGRHLKLQVKNRKIIKAVPIK